MKIVRFAVCIVAFAVLSAATLVSDLKAAGPLTVQQSVAQLESGLTDAWVGCHRCGYRRGYGYGGYGYGGYGYGGGYYGGYGGYGGGYGGWAYSRPYVYSYPSYSYGNSYYARPTYYTGSYNYAPAMSSCNCGGYASYQPSAYSVSSYSYPQQSVVYSAPSYTTGSVYGAPASVYTAPVYTPSYTSPSVISAPTPIAPPTYSTPASLTPTPAPYPAPPVEYTQPSAYRAPVTMLPQQMASSTTPMINTPSYLPTYGVTYSGVSAYGPINYSYSSANSQFSRLYGGSAW